MTAVHAVQFQTAVAPASYSRPQPFVVRQSTQSRSTNTSSFSSTPSSSRSHASVQPRSCTPSPYRQGPYEDDRARREREDTMLRDGTRRREEASFVDELCFDQLRLTHDIDTQRPHERTKGAVR